ncbi:response regulator [Hymenobacter sp. CRA2]|uniref:response regulator n=1 Tax=Hymenobacter sp. CRA2 TaxID=1955620 RepID=UPI00098F9A8C|nr:response regulator [Hymenobacter sp. CRA2]OON65617.1 response regulator [Hymenobacter sp. CRA2]
MEKLSGVLLVDDDQTTNFLNHALLTRLGVAERIFVALDGQQALDQVHAHCATPTPDCPALILLDVNMPGMNGIEFLQAYRQLPAGQRQATVIVMLTTSLHPRDVEQVQALGVDGFLNKPLNKDNVNYVLRTFFRRELPPA